MIDPSIGETTGDKSYSKFDKTSFNQTFQSMKTIPLLGQIPDQMPSKKELKHRRVYKYKQKTVSLEHRKKNERATSKILRDKADLKTRLNNYCVIEDHSRDKFPIYTQIEDLKMDLPPNITVQTPSRLN